MLLPINRPPFFLSVLLCALCGVVYAIETIRTTFGGVRGN
jgi:hypothetical protein